MRSQKKVPRISAWWWVRLREYGAVGLTTRGICPHCIALQRLC